MEYTEHMPFDLSVDQVMQWFWRSLPYVSLLLLFFYLLLGGVLDYHWRRYGIGIVKLFQLRASYVAIGIVLFGVLFVSLLAL